MYHEMYMDAYTEAVRYANEYKENMRVVAFDWQPLYEGEEAGVRYTVTNAVCTIEEMRNARLHNARVCRLVKPNEDTVEAIEAYQRGF